MGCFGWKCAKCGLPVTSVFEETAPETRALMEAVCVTKNNGTLMGVYDGYGRIDCFSDCAVDEFVGVVKLVHQFCYDNETYDELPESHHCQSQSIFFEDGDLEEIYDKMIANNRNMATAYNAPKPKGRTRAEIEAWIEDNYPQDEPCAKCSKEVTVCPHCGFDQHNDFLLLYEGIDEAFVGVSDHWSDHGHASAAVYDYEKCISTFMARDGMSYEDAVEHMEYNVTGGYNGRRTAIFVHTMED